MTEPAPVPYSDAAKRCSDTIRLHIVMGNSRRWAAIRLSDGGSDGVVYDTKADAIRHQLHEKECAYVFIPPDDMSPKDAETYLAAMRKLYDSGMPLAHPDVDPYIPIQTMDELRLRGIIP